MLVPSTFTGWYRKMMMKQEIASEMIRSRSQTDRTIARDGAVIEGCPWLALSSVTSDCPGIILILYASNVRASPRLWVGFDCALGGFGLQYYIILSEEPGSC